MAEEFNTDGMLDMYLFENEQLLEQLQERVLSRRTQTVLTKTVSMKYSGPCTRLKVRQVL